MLDVETLLSAAEAQTGLSDWGTDQAFRIGLGELVSAAVAAQLSEAGAASLQDQILTQLAIRLHFVEDEKLHPEITEQKIVRPLILTGLPRTGTTILHDLCALDPAGRAPQEWESAIPWPAPEAATYTTDPRIAQTQAGIDAMLEAMPVLRTMHPWGATLPADCLSFFAFSLYCTRFFASIYVPQYAHWLATAHPDGIYRSHNRALQQLQWKGPKGRWILKEPMHLLNLDQLIKIYPDACIVQTHRDPARTLPSNASLVWTIQTMLKPDLSKKEAGREALKLFGAHLERGTIARRDPAVDSRVLDIAYRDTVLDPVGTVKRIHDHFGFEFSAEHGHRIEEHIAHNPQGKHGEHKYNAEDFGLDQATLKGLMPEYRERFGHLLSEPAR
jgi:hypothetical protein